MVVKKCNHQLQRGQALFELIVFLPVFLYMIKIVFDYGDALNNSINQIKVVRSYYHFTNANDSNLPNLKFSQDFVGKGIQSYIGSDAYSWSNEKTSSGVAAMGSCVKVFSFLGSGITGDSCEAPQVEEAKTQFIRMYSAYGVCTGTWAVAQNPPTLFFLDWKQASSTGCRRL